MSSYVYAPWSIGGLGCVRSRDTDPNIGLWVSRYPTCLDVFELVDDVCL